jgi:hypothetical protein
MSSARRTQPKRQKEVASVERIVNSRPWAISAVCMPSTLAQAHVLGQPAVEVRLLPTVAPIAGYDATEKINNSMGSTYATGNGVATSQVQLKVSATRIPVAGVDKAQGGDARGIPPRGRPV